MSPAGDAFNHALHTANNWVADVSAAFGTSDRRYSNRVLRAWLHTLRDRLTVDAAAKFGQQLPELLRGVYYDGWEPHRTPVKYQVDQYVQRFALEAGIPTAQVPETSATITEVIANHMSTGQLAETLAELPVSLRALVTGSTAGAGEARRAARPARAATTGGDDRVARIEDQITNLTDALRTLAHGLENGHMTGTSARPSEVTRAARLADEILIAAGS